MGFKKYIILISLEKWWAMEKEERLELIKNDLRNSRDILMNFGDENRQKILLVLLENCANGGVRVGDIAEKVNLSRPAVSHHLKMLLENGIVYVEKKGTKNYYHVAGVDRILTLSSLFNNIELYVMERMEEIK